MAIPCCTSCGNHTFKLQDAKILVISDAMSEHQFVLCTECGGVVGVVESNNAYALVHELTRKLNMQLAR